jgi:hypothetical protein
MKNKYKYDVGTLVKLVDYATSERYRKNNKLINKSHLYETAPFYIPSQETDWTYSPVEEKKYIFGYDYAYEYNHASKAIWDGTLSTLDNSTYRAQSTKTNLDIHTGTTTVTTDTANTILTIPYVNDLTTDINVTLLGAIATNATTWYCGPYAYGYKTLEDFLLQCPTVISNNFMGMIVERKIINLPTELADIMYKVLLVDEKCFWFVESEVVPAKE